MKLDDSGMPRPLRKSKGTLRPVPWSQDFSIDYQNKEEKPLWGETNLALLEDARTKSLCLVCGLKVKEGVVLATSEYAKSHPFLTLQNLNQVRANPKILDGAPLHKDCMLLTRSHCENIRQLLQNGTFVEVPFKIK